MLDNFLTNYNKDGENHITEQACEEEAARTWRADRAPRHQRMRLGSKAHLLFQLQSEVAQVPVMLFFHLLDDQLCLDAHIQGVAFFRTEPWKHTETTDSASGSVIGTRWHLVSDMVH